MQYRREIDGLRALAVLPVILFHAGFKLFQGGFVGVDIFFVISGYLITTIIVTELEKGTFSMVNFYERRARRILPALLLVMLCCLPFAWGWLIPRDMKSFSQSMIAVPLFSSNFLFYGSGGTFGYFKGESELLPLLHTWSLAVEEQYYLLFPPLLIGLWRFGRARLAGVLIVLLIASLAAAQFGSIQFKSFAFYLLPTRAWELLIGALAALILLRRGGPVAHPFAQWGAALGLTLIAIAVFAFDNKTPFPGLYALVPTLGAVLIVVYGSEKTLVGGWLGSRPLVGLGLISYSAYLWHQPLFAFARLGTIYRPGQALFGWLALAALILAYFSWRYIEMPFRARDIFNRRQIFSAASICSLLFVVLGLAGYASGGFPQRFHNEFLARNEASFDLPRIDNGWCFYSIDTIESLKLGADGLSCSLGEKRRPVATALLLGDSFAGHYEPLWDAVGKQLHFRVDAATTNWCFPSLTSAFPGPTSSRAYAQCLFDRNYFRGNAQRYDIIILAAAWPALTAPDYLGDIRQIIDWSAQRASIVVVMAAPVHFDYGPLWSFEKAGYRDLPFDIDKIGRRKDAAASAANDALEKIAGAYSNVVFVGRDVLFAVGGKPAYITPEGVPFNWDGIHLSIYGAQAAAAIFAKSAKYDDLARRISVLEPREEFERASQ